MKNKEFDFLVFIGNCAPWTVDHNRLLTNALELSEHVIILVNGSNRPSSITNPWSFYNRLQMITLSHVVSSNPDRVLISPLFDYKYDKTSWCTNICKIVNEFVDDHEKRKTGLIYEYTDKELVRLFPQWTPVDREFIPNEDGSNDLSWLFTQEKIPNVSDNTAQYIEQFKTRYTYECLLQEYNAIQQYKKSWEVAPFPPIFVTTDIVLVQSNHILMITRRNQPGKDLVALPGGYVNSDETVQQAAFRELKEETNIQLDYDNILNYIKGYKMFDSPDRDTRGRTITHAFFIELPPSKSFPKILAGDDAKSATWMPIWLLDSEVMFADHYDIITHFI